MNARKAAPSTMTSLEPFVAVTAIAHYRSSDR
jgi:hypothetical protein